jgi:hypothetical protein
VGYGPVPKELVGATASNDTWEAGFSWQASPERYLLKGGTRSGRFLVEGGTRVTVHRNANAEDACLLFHLLHPVAAALFRQRGLLVLHASTVHTSAGAIALCGKSLAGKSTTLAALLQNGCEMISDDLTILKLADSSSVETVSGAARIYLWEDAAQGIGLNLTQSIRHPMRRAKAALSLPGEPCRNPAPLKKLYILQPAACEDVTLLRLNGSDKLEALLSCVYGPLLPEEHPGLFPLLSFAARHTDIYRIQRPENHWTVDEIVKRILNG